MSGNISVVVGVTVVGIFVDCAWNDLLVGDISHCPTYPSVPFAVLI